MMLILGAVDTTSQLFTHPLSAARFLWCSSDAETPSSAVSNSLIAISNKKSNFFYGRVISFSKIGSLESRKQV